ncbi:MAG TPA: hypothetical protein PKY22_09580, partial [Accumulibacter sp.]|nr:hypothetical protein [Accumulibacter sp.]
SPSSSRYAQQKSGTFPLTVTRDSGMRMAACPTEITIDGESAVSLWQGQTVTLFVPAGEYVLGTKLVALCGGGLVETEAIVKPGRQSVFRVGFDFNGTMTISRTTAR